MWVVAKKSPVNERVILVAGASHVHVNNYVYHVTCGRVSCPYSALSAVHSTKSSLTACEGGMARLRTIITETISILLVYF